IAASHRFSVIKVRALRATKIASSTGLRRSPRKTASACACVTSAALIGDIDTCAAASEGASLRPSPTIRTRRPLSLSVSINTIFLAGLKPAEKIVLIETLRDNGRRVLMVGDGLNDAPSLAAAHVSMSPISAADVTQAQADAVFLGERLKPVLDAILVARSARTLMTENLWLAAIYNAVAVPIAIAGAATPLIAALAMSGSSMLVTLNALRARRVKS